MMETKTFAASLLKHMYFARIEDVDGILYVVAFTVEASAEHP
jgi:hypothetical protein